MSKEIRALQNQITELKSRLIKKELYKQPEGHPSREDQLRIDKLEGLVVKLAEWIDDLYEFKNIKVEQSMEADEETQYRELIEKYKKVENRIADNHFYQVALNLSGKREELEQRASELIDGLGYIEALRQTRKTK